MLVREYRPKKFSEVLGQPRAIKVLQALVGKLRKGEEVVRVWILEGSWGSGKTTLSRVVGKALSCESYKDGDICGECNSCKEDIMLSGTYDEYDAGSIGNIKDIRALMDGAYFVGADLWRVIVLDETHLISREAQGALLKFLEELPERVVVIMCTTDSQKLLDTILSRAMVITINTVQFEDSNTFIERVLSAEDSARLSESKRKALHRMSGGHLRNLGMLCEKWLLEGDSIFEASIDLAITKYILSVFRKDKTAVLSAVDGLLSYSLSETRKVFYSVLSEHLLRGLDKSDKFLLKLGVNEVERGRYIEYISKLIVQCNEDYFVNGLRSTESFRAALLSLFIVMVK